MKGKSDHREDVPLCLMVMIELTIEHSEARCTNSYCNFLFEIVQKCTDRTVLINDYNEFESAECQIIFSKVSKFKKIYKLSYAKCCNLSNSKKYVTSSVLAICSLLSF